MGDVLRMLRPDRPRALAARIGPVNGAPRPREVEHRVVRPTAGGRLRVMRAADDGGGRARRASSAPCRTTERRSYEAALVRAREEACQASQAKSAFLANMSHEPARRRSGLTTTLAPPRATSAHAARVI